MAKGLKAMLSNISTAQCDQTFLLFTNYRYLRNLFNSLAQLLKSYQRFVKRPGLFQRRT